MPRALITGAGRGIGKETARVFLGAGWTVLALDKDFSSFDLTGAGLERVDYDLTDLAGIAGLRVENHDTEGWLRITVPWPDFRLRFPFAELPAPEHAV